LEVSFEQPSLLYCDNDATRYISSNPMFHERTKHIEIDCHIVGKIEEESHPFAFHFHHRKTSRHLYQSQVLNVSRIFVSSWVSSIFSLHLGRGGLEDMDTRLLEGN